MIEFEPFVWPSRPPSDCPFEPSQVLGGVRFLGRCSDYNVADTFYPSWSQDGHLYSPFTDGKVAGVESNSSGYAHTFEHKEDEGVWVPTNVVGADQRVATTGHAKLVGDDPLNLEIEPIGLHEGAPYPYGGRYPCGSLHHNGIWYYGTYCLGPYGETFYGDTNYNWPHLGPFVGFRISKDDGLTWEDTDHTPTHSIFSENGLCGYPVKIGAPHFVDFGKNMEHSPDGKAYLLAQGSDLKFYPPANFCHLSWINADQVYLIRVTPSPETINDPGAYEFFAGHDEGGAPKWSSSFEEISPLLEWEGNMGCVTATWHPGLNKYIMAVTDGGDTRGRMHTYLLESDTITGPWRLVSYLKDFGQQAYFVNFPSKFLSADSLRMWMCYSGNFCVTKEVGINPPGTRYGLVLQEVDLIRK